MTYKEWVSDMIHKTLDAETGIQIREADGSFRPMKQSEVEALKALVL